MKTFFLCLVLFIDAECQEIGAAPAKIWTNNSEIGNPYGFSIYFFQPLGKLGVKFEYVYAKNSRSYYGLLNGGFLLPSEGYTEDFISSSSTFGGIELSIQLPNLIELYNNNLNIGAGFTFDKFSREKSGLHSGKKYYEHEHKPGIFYSVSISRAIFEWPLKLELLFKHKALAAGSYATDTEQSFVNPMEIKELQINLAYVF